MSQNIFVDVIVPVHDAATTIAESVDSAMMQKIPSHLVDFFSIKPLDIAVCCYNDGSTDDSAIVLEQLKAKYNEKQPHFDFVSSVLLVESSDKSNGAPTARNLAAKMRTLQSDDHVLVWLDSDDTMHEHRIAEQVFFLYKSPHRNHLLLGSHFDRDPPDSTWHYAQWANNLSKERLLLECFREVTVIQPTWCMMKTSFNDIGGYVTAKFGFDSKDVVDELGFLHLFHPQDTPETLRLAEDLRFLHAHLHSKGELDVVPKCLVTYRHRAGQSQSSQTPRKLLLQLRALALETRILQHWDKFVVWGAGRDGKDFVKALSSKARKKVVCMVDVDHRKIENGYYAYREMDIKIPIVHFSLLAKDKTKREELQEAYYQQIDNEPGRITKQKPSAPASNKATKPPPRKKFKVCTASDLNTIQLPDLPVIVCVAMYRTNGVLEKNVASISRTEGEDLWHFS